MVNGASPGPEPAAQARDSSSGLTRSSWRTWPHRKLRRKVPRVDRALTAQPMAPVVPPVRNTSASSMQSPPASAEATRVSHLVARVRPPRGIAQVEALPDEFGQAEMPGQGGRKEQPGIGHQTRIVEGDLDTVGIVLWQHLLGDPCFWLVFCLENHYPRCTGALSCLFRTLLHALPRWIGAKKQNPAYWLCTKMELMTK